ncbi:hypothetical protein EFS54_01165 [Periweissella beninensis]|uniref:Uncharacterized protein n=1 Tax=Periweissella beninensis TaxID=504936 RepID=A0ABT0VFR6_9LACO|nr:hypothetical protein [Periweissella beninensis]MCT4395631.1 hypothetical protein [Periweissella beninensis]
MHLKKAITAYQVNPKSWKVIKKIKLKANTRVTVANTANLSWIISANKLAKRHGYQWIIKKHYNTSWLKY